MDYKRIPFMNGYDPIQIGTGFAGPAVTAGKSGDGPTRMYRVKEGAAPGWAGFFGWLAATHPKFYDYARAALPNYAEDRQSYVSAGPILNSFDPATGIPQYN